MPFEEKLIKDFLGGDPVSGRIALLRLIRGGDEAEDQLFKRPITHKRIQVQRRWLQYVAQRRTTALPRILERINSSPDLGDAYAAAFLCAAFPRTSDITDVLYRTITAKIKEHDPGAASVAVMGYGYAGADLSSVFRDIEDDSHAWEKLRTAAFRAASASCARLTSGNLWALENLVTNTWDAGHRLQQISESPESSIPGKQVDDVEITFQANYTFPLWQRSEVGDLVLREWSQHPHFRVRWFGALILANLHLERSTAAIAAWLQREKVPVVRASLIDALRRGKTSTGADLILDLLDRSGEGGDSFAQVGYLAADKRRAIKTLAILAEDETKTGAEAIVALARLGVSHLKLGSFADSNNYYLRLNAWIALGYLGDQRESERLERRVKEAANETERVFGLAALSMLGAPNAGARLHRALCAQADDTENDQHLDLFLAHDFLKDAVLAGLVSAGSQTAEVLAVWLAEFDPLETIPSPIEEIETGSDSEQSTTPMPGRVSNEQSILDPTGKPMDNDPEAKNAKDPATEQDIPSRFPESNSDADLLTRLGKIAGIGGIAMGVFLVLLKPLHLATLDSDTSKLFLMIVFGVTVIALIIWGSRDRKNDKLAIVLGVVAIIVAGLGWSLASHGPNGGEGYEVSIDVMKQDGTNVTTNEASVYVPGRQVSQNQDARSWTFRADAKDKGKTFQINAEIPGAGSHGREPLTLGEDHQPAVHVKLVPGGSVDVKVLVITEPGLSVADATVFIVGGTTGITDRNGQTTLTTTESVGSTIQIHARHGDDEVASEDNYRVGSGAVTLKLKHAGRGVVAKVDKALRTQTARSGVATESPTDLPTGSARDQKSPDMPVPQPQTQNQSQQTNISVVVPPPAPDPNLHLSVNSVRLPAWFDMKPDGNEGFWPTEIVLKIDDQEVILPVKTTVVGHKNQFSMDSLSRAFSLTKGTHTFGYTVTLDQLVGRLRGKHQLRQAPCLKSFTIDEKDTVMTPFLTLSSTSITQCLLLRPSDPIPSRAF